MRVWLDLALIGLSDHWKWAVGAVTVLILVVIGTLFFGVLGSDTAAADLAPTTAVEPTAVPDAISEPTPIPDIVVSSPPSPAVAPIPAPGLTDAVLLPPRVNVPIYLTNAKNLGSLEFVLTYDPSVLEVSDVEAGGLAQTALFDFGTRETGRLWTGMIDTDGINGDGTVAVVSFKVVGPGDSASPLTLENVFTYDAKSLLDILTDSTSGSFTVGSQALSAPTLVFPR